MEQRVELQSFADALQERADVYIINSDTVQESLRLKHLTGITVSVLLDRQLAAARSYDLLPKRGQPMGGMTGLAQMGFVIVDAAGAIRVQRVDLNFGQHASQMLEILRLFETRAPQRNQ